MLSNMNAPLNSPSVLQYPIVNSLSPLAMASPAQGDSGQLNYIFTMLSLLSQVMSLSSGSGLVPGSSNFGEGTGAVGGDPTAFLGIPKGKSGGGARGARRSRSSGGSSSTPSASSAPVMGSSKDAGGGWVNPVGGKYTITSGFGSRKPPTAASGNFHGGTDMAGAANTPILAAKGGVVKVSKDMTTSYGKWIEIQHDDGTRSRYAHMNQRMVQVGERVKAGQQIGKMGSTGNSTGNHLHFEVLDKNGKQVDTSKAMKL